MRAFTLIILILLTFCFSCQKSVKTKPKQFSLEMNRTNCYGTCPVYSLKIGLDGKVEFEGVNYTATKGKAESQIADEKVKELISEVTKSNFFSFEDDYSQGSKTCSSSSTDCPSVILTIKYDENEKTIKHYNCCFVKSWLSKEDALQPLTDLENKIDEIVETKRWIGERK